MEKYCEYIGAELCIVSVPSTKNWTTEKHNGLKKFADEENIDFLDFNIIADEIGIDWDADTLDKGVIET